MSKEVIIGGTDRYALASQRGWSNVIDAVEQQDGIDELQHLIEYGWTEPASALVADIELFLPNTQGDVTETLEQLLDKLKSAEAEASVMVTNGQQLKDEDLAADEPNSDNIIKSLARAALAKSFKTEHPKDKDGKWIGVKEIVRAIEDPIAATDLMGRVSGANEAKLVEAIEVASQEIERGRAPEPWVSVGGTFNSDYLSIPDDVTAISALSVDKQPFYGKARELKDGTPVGLRIDIPAYITTGEYVVTIHEKAKKSVGRRIGYDSMAMVKGAKFFSREDYAADIMIGRSSKLPIATVEGKIVQFPAIPDDIDSWVPVGYDPKKCVFWYDKRTGREVIRGKEAICAGNTVFVLDPEFGDRDAVNSPDLVQSVSSGEL